jgi:hypothetical protein
MSTQNPIIPTPLQAQGIDAVIQDLQTHLDFDLSWLTNGMGQGYRLAKVRTPQNIVFLPEVYLGTAQNKYFSATPDNDKTGQSIFVIGTETLPNYQTGFFGYLEYEMSILFTANLKLIDSTLLETEDFTEHLIADVRQSIIRNLLGKAYRITIDNIERGFENTYSDFDIANDRGISYLPLTHFRLNCTVQVKEDCPPTTLNRCTSILQNLTSADLLGCILPTYDFSSPTTQAAVTVQQQSDLTDWLCTAMPTTCPDILALIAPYRVSCVIPSLNFAAGFDDDFNALDGTQISDLQTRICTPASTQMYKMSFDGVNEFIQTPNNAALDFTNVQPFSAAIWAQSTNYSATQTLLSRRALGTTRGYVFFFLSGHLHLYMGTSVTNYIYIRTTGVTFTNNVQYLLGFTKDSTSAASGIKLYVNGVSVSTFTIQDNLNGTLSNSQALLIGADNISGWYFTGFLGLSRLWGAELTAGQMLTEYNGGTPLNSPQLLGIQRFGWKAGQDAYFGQQWVFPDESGNMINPLPYSINSELADRQAI